MEDLFFGVIGGQRYKISDAERAEDLLRMARGKRLTYRRIDETTHA
jgi:hypothetical protein